MRLRPRTAEEWGATLRTQKGDRIKELFRFFLENPPQLAPPTGSLEQDVFRALEGIGYRARRVTTVSAQPRPDFLLDPADPSSRYLRGMEVPEREQEGEPCLSGGIGCSLGGAFRFSYADDYANQLMAEREWALVEARAAAEAAWSELALNEPWLDLPFRIPGGGTPRQIEERAVSNLLVLLGFAMVFLSREGPTADDGMAITEPFLDMFRRGNYPVGWPDASGELGTFLVITS